MEPGPKPTSSLWPPGVTTGHPPGSPGSPRHTVLVTSLPQSPCTHTVPVCPQIIPQPPCMYCSDGAASGRYPSIAVNALLLLHSSGHLTSSKETSGITPHFQGHVTSPHCVWYPPHPASTWHPVAIASSKSTKGHLACPPTEWGQ